jgi:hypothetical protein
MPRYFFHMEDGATAREEAIRFCGEMLSPCDGLRPNNRQWDGPAVLSSLSAEPWSGGVKESPGSFSMNACPDVTTIGTSIGGIEALRVLTKFELVINRNAARALGLTAAKCHKQASRITPLP